MESNVFIVIDKFGELFIKDVFVTFDYPRVFSCTNKFNCKFLFYSYDFDDDFDDYEDDTEDTAGDESSSNSSEE